MRHNSDLRQAGRLTGHVCACTNTPDQSYHKRAALHAVSMKSAEAQFQLSRISAVFEAIEEGRHPPEVLPDVALALGGLCRVVEKLLHDIRLMAGECAGEEATGRHGPPGSSLSLSRAFGLLSEAGAPSSEPASDTTRTSQVA